MYNQARDLHRGLIYFPEIKYIILFAPRYTLIHF
jgi:hypothetical protein